MANLPNCLIALQIANRLGEEPLTVMQNIYVVSGRPGWKTEYVIARANKAGVFSSRITWKTTGRGDTLAVTACATLANTGEAIEVTCDMAMAKAEEWTRNKKYTSMPEHMLRWRSAAMLIRLYAPEVMIGMPTYEEVETMPAEMRDVTPAKPSRDMQAALDEFAGVQAQTTDVLDEMAGGAEPTESGERAKAEADAAAEAAAAKKAEADKADAEAKKAEAAKAKEAAAAEKAAADKAAASKTKEAAKAQAGELDETLDENPAPKGEASKEPRIVEEYLAMLKAHVDGATDHAALKTWFLSKEQKDLRGKCSVVGPHADEAKNYTLAKIETLKTAG
jgi:hypothetical protein